MSKNKKYNFIDLFSGCGGFSYGLEKNGWNCLAGIDFNELAIQTFKENHSKETIALVRDMTKFSPEELLKLISKKTVDLIIGGPPCQGFSVARQNEGTNSGNRLVEDPRRELYKDFLRFVNFFRPKVFVMENVLGIKKMQFGVYFTAIQNEAREIGYRVLPIQINTWEYGVPQKRIRQLFIGTLNELPIFNPLQFLPKSHSLSPNDDGLLPVATLGEAIEDLPILEAGEERLTQDYDLELRKSYLKKYSGDFLLNTLDVSNANKLTWHCARPHLERDLRDFGRLLEGETCSRAIKRGVIMEFPYNRATFKDRYTRQSRNGLCSTIVAHLRNDGLMFIHPTQTRSLTPREVARVQTFPDTFNFIGKRSNVFTQIGNAVPPLIGRVVGKGVIDYLEFSITSMPKKLINAIEKNKISKELDQIINESYREKPLSIFDDLTFIGIWKKIHILHPHLHPDSALDNGNLKSISKRGVSQSLEPFYIRSGWPCELVPLALEANKRFIEGRLSSSDYFHTS